MKTWYSQSPEETLVALASSSAGLTTAEAKQRLATNGPNQLKEDQRIRPLQIFLNQFKTFITWILIAAGAVSGFLGEGMDAIAILAIVILNAVIGFYQEFNAEKSIAALKKMTTPQAKVRRDGRVMSIMASAIVTGDILLLEAGDVVAADARLLTAASLKCIEAALTGESKAQSKNSLALAKDDIPLGDRNNMVFMGTSIAVGTGMAVVVATAMDTELGRIAGLLVEAEAEPGTPLQRKLDAFGQILVWVALGIVALLFVLGLLRGTKLVELTMTSISLAVAAVPEGLPAVVTVALSLGVLRMARRRALVRKLAAVETLGSTSVICTDKTGTLTVGEMTVRMFYVAGRSYPVTGEGYAPVDAILFEDKPLEGQNAIAVQELATIIIGCNNAHLVQEEGLWKTLGDPTEGALLAAGAKAGVDRERIERETPKLYEIPFDSDRKRSSVIRRMQDGKLRAFVNGAPGILLERCTSVYTDTGIRPLTEADRQQILSQTSSMAQQALRVLASAYRDNLDNIVPIAELSAEEVEQDLVFVGLSGMYDPPRKEAQAAVAQCRDAGIRVVMITGDHPHTAIAREIGIASVDDLAVSGVELDKLSDTELRDLVAKIAVYARVTAEHKLRIIRAWQANDAVVAMTGDGVNDAPAIRGADIGITMGKTGTEVTKQAADMIITDDNFATIIAAVEEGRGIYDNIRKTLQYLLAGSTGELLLVAVCVIAGMPTPLLPIHLLWINLITDGLPALCLATDPIDRDVMQRRPRHRSERITDGGFLRTMFLTGFLTAGVAFAVYAYGLQTGTTETARTSAFAVLVYAELLRSFGARSETKPVWRIALFTNTNLVIVVGISFGLQVLSQHNAMLGSFLKTSAMPLADTFLLLAIGTIPLLVLEAVKLLQNARRQKTAHLQNHVSKAKSSSGQGWAIIKLAMQKFSQMDGAQSAAAFAYYAFFSLFPLIVLIVTLASAFIDRNQAASEVILYVKHFVPITGAMQSYIFDTISGVINASTQMGIVASLVLIWAAMQFFTTLIAVTNKAWGDEISVGWRFPFKDMGFLIILVGSMLFIVLVPILTKMTTAWLFTPNLDNAWLYALGNYCLPNVMVFMGLSGFYRLAPIQLKRFSEVWAAALCATLLLQIAESFFVIYLQIFSSLNAIYGAFGGFMALLTWIYLSGCIVIFGACMCAAQAQIHSTSGQVLPVINKPQAVSP